MLYWKRIIRQCCLAGLSVVLFCGCIPVEDIEPAWSDGKMDPAIGGAWRDAEGEVSLETGFIAFKPQGDVYEMEARSAGAPEVIDLSQHPAPLARTVETAGVKFIVSNNARTMKSLGAMRPPSSDGASEFHTIRGGVWRYEVTTQTLTLFTLKDERLNQAVETGEIAGIADSLDLPVYLSRLDEQTLHALAGLASDAEAWKADQYVRVENLEEAVKRAREYPATTSTEVARQVYVDIPELEKLYSHADGPLRRHLQASPEWYVHQEGPTDVVATRREQVDGLWRHKSSVSYDNGYLQARGLFRFASRSEGVNPVKNRILGYADLTTDVSGVEGTVSLTLRKGRQGVESYLTIGYPGLWFEVFEQSEAEVRTYTRDSVAWLREFTDELSMHADEVTLAGYYAGAMPAGGISRGKPRVELEGSGLTAYVNPGEQGYVFMKVFDEATSAPIDKNIYRWGEQEYTGWSSDPDVLFLYQHDMDRLLRHVADTGKAAAIQIWFRPHNGQAHDEWWEDELPGDKMFLEVRMPVPVGVSR